MSTPYICFSSNQLKDAPNLPEKVPCFECGKLVKVQNSTPKPTLQFISCCGKAWLVGVKGKLVEHIKPKYTGELKKC